MTTQIQFRRDLSTEWTFSNPILENGEIGLETDTNIIKVGDGYTPWNNLRSAGHLGPTGTNANVQLSPGILEFTPSPSELGWLRCDGSTISAATYPSLNGILPTKPGFSGGIGYFSFIDGGIDYGYGNGTSFVSTDLDAYLPTAQWPNGSGALVSSNNDSYRNDLLFYDAWHSEYEPAPWIWGYDFKTSVVINRYGLAAAPNHTWMTWNAFEFQASNDNTNWTTLAVVSGFSTYNYPFVQDVLNYDAYRYYRFYITSTNYNLTGDGYANMGKIAMQGISIPPDTSILVLPDIPTQVVNGTTYYAHIKV